MSPPFLGHLPAAQFPRNALLDFSPVSDALDSVQRNRMFDAEMGLHREKFEHQKERARVADQRAAENHADQQTQRKIRDAGAIAALAMEKPELAPALMAGIYAQNPQAAATLKAYGVDPNDHVAAARVLHAQALGPQDPLERQEREARIAKLQREAAGGGDPETMGLNPVPVVDENGNPVLAQIGSRGSYKEVPLPDGRRFTPNLQAVPTGTGTTFVQKGTAQPVATIAKDLRGAAEQKELGEGSGKAKVNLSAVEEAGRSITEKLDGVLNDPHLPEMTGPLQGRLPNVSGAANRVQSKLDQIQGAAFLQQFERLRGGGAITEKEGEKATAALTRLATMTQGDPDYRQALEDAKREVAAVVALARRKAGGGTVSPPPDAGGWSIKRLD